MHLDPFIPLFVAIVLGLSVMNILAHVIKQPPIVGYILTGMLLGPFGLKLISNTDSLHRLGSIGVILLLFFVGMQISPEKFAKNWKVPLIGTFLQVMISVAVVIGFGHVLAWPMNRCILIGFVISLSSTAVILKLLDDRKELQTQAGQDILGISLAQDIAIIPMMIYIGTMGDNEVHVYQIGKQLIGTLILSSLVIWVTLNKNFRLPFGHIIKGDKELQVLTSLFICFGLACVSGLLELSSALGAFVAGIIIGSSKDTHWVQESMQGFRVVFMAVFFLSIGILVDFDFFTMQWVKIVVLVSFVLIANTIINAMIIRILGRSWKSSFYCGAMLSQVGEFSFMLIAIGLQTAIISNYAYQMTIAIIALSLLVSPLWIALVTFIVNKGMGLKTHDPIHSQ